VIFAQAFQKLFPDETPRPHAIGVHFGITGTCAIHLRVAAGRVLRFGDLAEMATWLRQN
jgi:hypothetical protein